MRILFTLVLLCGFGISSMAQQSASKVTAPDSFTPNEDGKEDTFLPNVEATNIDNYVFLVFDTNKQVVFRTKDRTAAWGGMNLAKSETAAAGTYTWQITFQENGERKDHTGTVALKR